MGKKHFSLKALLSVVLALMLTFTAVVPVMAAPAEGPFTITITPDDYTKTGGDVTGRFEAYAVFTGVLSEDYINSGEGPDTNQLANIEWGSGIDSEKIADFVAALKDSDIVLVEANPGAEPEPIEELTVGDLFTAAIEAWDDAVAEGKTNVGSQAAAIAKVLNDNAEEPYAAALLRVFAKLAAENKAEDPTATSAWVDADGNWQIEVDDAGYYLIVDTYETSDEEDAVSSYMLAVVADQTINMKSDVPTVTKEIVNYDQEDVDDNGVENANGASFDIGETIIFKLTGTLPENYDDFDTYFYSFIDTLAKGLTYTGGVSADDFETAEGYIKVTVGEVDITECFEITTSENNDGTTTLTITCEDLKTVVETVEDAVINSDATIVVEYTAKLNNDAVIGRANDNTVKLEFSNDPNGTSHGKTHEEIVHVYTFGLDIIKLDGSEEEDTPLGNVGFRLSRETEDGTQYGVFEQVGNRYKFVDWIDEDDVETFEDSDYADAGYVLDVYTIGRGSAKGKLFIEGLREGSYTLEESVVPDGYDKMADIVFTISVSYAANGNLKKVTDGDENHGEGNQNDNDMYYINIAVEGNRDDVWGNDVQSGDNPMGLINYPANFLPGTGGMGTWLFYILGGLLVVGAAAFLILSGNKSPKKQ